MRIRPNALKKKRGDRRKIYYIEEHCLGGVAGITGNRIDPVRKCLSGSKSLLNTNCAAHCP